MGPLLPIPKKEPGTWRLIVHLSSPDGGSINDGISEKWVSLSYVTTDMVIISMGPGTIMHEERL